MEHNEEADGSFRQTLEAVITTLVRRRWIIIGTSWSIAVGAILLLLHLPNRYTSEATLLVANQKVPERYVVSTMTSDISQTLDSMAEEVLSRPRLLELIEELGLYPKQSKSATPEHLIEIARGDVSIEPLKDRKNAFKISFIADTPNQAQAVTAKLTTLFIEYNLKARSEQATTTTTFLHEQLEIAETKLTEQEQRLRDFKLQYLGELPEQQQGNLGTLSGLQNQLDNVMANRSQAQQQRLYLESLLTERQRLGRRAALNGVSIGGQIGVSPLEAAQRDLARLQAERRTLLTVYTSQFPDVQKKTQEIKTQQAMVDELRTAKVDAIPDRRSNELMSDTEDDIGNAQLKSQLQANALEMENLARKEQKLQTDIEQYRAKLNLTPVREQQLTSMQRDYDLLRQHYGELLKKKQESQLATNLEKRQEGQQFRLADPPNLPTRPSSPKRVKISFIALAGGLLLGCVLALLAEARKAGMHSEADVSRGLSVPLIIGVPLLFTPAEEQNRSRMAALEWFAGCVLVLIVAVAEVYVYQLG